MAFRESRSIVDYPSKTSFPSIQEPSKDVEEQDGGPYEGGALQPGGIANLYSKEYMAILFNYMGVGIYNGVFRSMTPILFENYFGMPSFLGF